MALIAGLAIAAGVGALVGSQERAEQAHERAQLLAAYNRVTAEVARMSMPAGIQRESASACSNADACGRSMLTPPDLVTRLRHIVGGDAVVPPSGTSGCASVNPVCPTTVAGRIHGFEVIAIAFWHLVVVRHGNPPRGAVRLPKAPSHVFFVGSDVDVQVVMPKALQAG